MEVILVLIYHILIQKSFENLRNLKLYLPEFKNVFKKYKYKFAYHSLF